MRKPVISLPAYLTEAMAAAGLSQSELARRAGVNESPISRWLKGSNTPSIEQLRLIAPVLGVPLIDLVVSAGHLTADEVGMADHPQPPKPPVWSRDAILDMLRSELGAAPELRDLVLNLLAVAWRGRDAVVHSGARTADERNHAYLQELRRDPPSDD